MSVFEIEGVAKREVVCDLMNMKITFRAVGDNSYDVSQKAMNECDGFLDEISKLGMELKNIQYDEDDVDEAGFHDCEKMYAKRTIRIRIPFDMKSVNQIQFILQKGKYDYELDVDCDLKDRSKLMIELAKEALQNSKKEAEQLAEVLGIKVKGVESIRKDRWDDDITYDDYFNKEEFKCLGYELAITRPSDDLGAKTKEESVKLKVRWILE